MTRRVLIPAGLVLAGILAAVAVAAVALAEAVDRALAEV